MERLFSSFNTFNVELFIEEVRNRPTIWDMQCDDYSDKLKRNECWREVCRSLFPDFDSMESSKQCATGKNISFIYFFNRFLSDRKSEFFLKKLNV